MKVDNVVLLLDGLEFLFQGIHNQFKYLTGELEVLPEVISAFNDNIRQRNL